MWQVENLTPFADERAWLRGRDGSEIWLVAVKATFDVLADGETVIAAEQPPVLRLAEHHEGLAGNSLKYDADLILTKRATDVLVIGNAHAPAGQRVTQLDCGFEVGRLRKRLRVFGDRAWGAFGPSRPALFASMPLRWERAYGGADQPGPATPAQHYPLNPLGCGFATSASRAADRAVPNIEYPGALLSSWRDRPPPAGFGVVASHWPPRVAYSGTYDDHWSRTRRPLLPDDFDDRFFQSAPADQQCSGFLLGGETVRLFHLHPAGTIEFALPLIKLQFESRFYDGSREQHPPARLHTVILEPDGPRVSLVWHSALPCHVKGDLLERTVVTLHDDEALDVSIGGDGRAAATSR